MSDQDAFSRDMIGEGDILLVSNMAETDDTFTGHFGDAGWMTINITRAYRDAEAGRFGSPKTFPISLLMASIVKVEVDPQKVASLHGIVHQKQTLLTAQFGRFIYVVDGHHRIHAMSRTFVEVTSAYIMSGDLTPYIVMKRRFKTQKELDAFKASVRVQRGQR